MEFSRQEYQGGLPFLILGELPDPGIKPESLVSPAMAGGFFNNCVTWEAHAAAAAAAAAKSLQSCPTLCDPIDGSAPGSPVPGILQARTPQWVVMSLKED